MLNDDQGIKIKKENLITCSCRIYFLCLINNYLLDFHGRKVTNGHHVDDLGIRNQQSLYYAYFKSLTVYNENINV